ncbi:unnamed protein product [Effrenium voratum]|nr:unnamed protein product [Effrenium voratum]
MHTRLEHELPKFAKMVCVRLLDGTDVMTTVEYALWRDELRGHEDGGCFFDALRRHLATRLHLPNFRQIALVCGLGNLGPETPWDIAECLTAVVRQYVEAATGESEGRATCVDLLQATERGDAQHVLELLEKPHDPNAAGRIRVVTPLHYASANGHLEIVRCLLDVNADTDKVTSRGHTPLHVAACQGHQAVAQCLLDAGADKEKTADQDLTPLHLAAGQGHHATVQCLLDAGADKEKTAGDAATPLHLATRAIRQLCSACWMRVLTKRRQTMWADQRCISLHTRATGKLCSACWMLVLTRSARPTRDSQRCIWLLSWAIRQLCSAYWMQGRTTAMQRTTVTHRCYRAA